MIQLWLSTPATLAWHWEELAGKGPVAYLGASSLRNHANESKKPLRLDWSRLCVKLLAMARLPVGRLFLQAEIEEILRASLRDDRCASVAAFQGVLQRPGQVRLLSDRLKRTAAREFAEAEALPWFADPDLEVLRGVYQENLTAAGGIDVPGLFLKFLAESQEQPLQDAIGRWHGQLAEEAGGDPALIVPRGDRLLEDTRKFERAVTLVLLDRFRDVHLGAHLWPDDPPERFESLTAEWLAIGAEPVPLPPRTEAPEAWFVETHDQKNRRSLLAENRVRFVETRDPKAEIAVVAERALQMIEAGIEPFEISIRTPQHGTFVDRLRESLEASGVAVETAPVRLVESPQVRAVLDVAAAIEEDWPADKLADLIRHPDFRRSAFAAEVSPEETARLALRVERLGNVNGIELIRRMLLVRADEQAVRSRNHDANVAGMLIAVEALSNLEKVFVPPPAHATWMVRVETLRGIVSESFEPEFAQVPAIVSFFDALENGVGNSVDSGGETWSWRDFLREAQLRSEAWNLSEPGETASGLRITSGSSDEAGQVGHLVLCGMTEGHFPSRSRIREALAREPNVDLESLRAEELRRFREAVGAASESLWISRHRRDARGIDTEPAGFLRDVPWDPVEIPPRRYDTPTEAEADELRTRIDAANERVKSRNGHYAGELANPFVLRDLADRFGPGYLFSATSLEAASMCPFRFFGQYVLGLGEGEIDDDLGTDYLAEGETIHAVLEDFHRAFSVVEIERFTDDEIRERLDRLVAERHPCPPRLESSELGRARWEVQNRRITIRMAGYARQFRRDLEPSSGSGRSKPKSNAAALFGGEFEILQCELRSGQAEGALKHLRVSGGESGGDFRIGGRIDRIDGEAVGQDRRVRLLDYKTGSPISERDLKAKLHLQLPIYAMMVHESRFGGTAYHVVDVGFWYLRNLRGGYASVRDWLSPGAPLDVETLSIEYQPFLQSIVAGVRAGRFPVRPRAAGCEDRCELAELCRIRERRSRRHEESSLESGVSKRTGQN